MEMITLSNADYTKAKPITTSNRIAHFSGYSKQVVDNLIKNHLKDFKLVGSGTCPILKSEQVLITDKQSTQARTITYYELDKEQAMFLLTLMRNNERIIKFKASLINAFCLMEKELIRRTETRIIGTKIYRKNLTDMIQFINSGEEVDDFIHFSYKIYTDLVYKKVFGLTTKQLRIERKWKPNINIRDFLTVEELAQVQQVEEQIRKECIKQGWVKLKPTEAYQKVKQFLKLDN